jgi:hypothetical protein
VTLEEALAMVADGRIADGTTVILLEHVALHGFPAQAGRGRRVGEDGTRRQ